MTKIAFLVKNYIGFGHIRRSILIANEIRKLRPEIEIFFVSQAKSLQLFQKEDFPVVNFPFLQRLPTNAAEVTYRRFLDIILDKLDLDMVIEDTYPDEWYLSTPSLRNVPRLLILRRIDPISFNNFRESGYFSAYDRVLVTHSQSDFLLEGHTANNELIIHMTDIFRFFGPVFASVNKQQLARVKRKYLRSGVKSVVVSTGAGGDHFNDAFCEQIYKSMEGVAKSFDHFKGKVHFILILGPYYRGYKPIETVNLTCVDYEPELAALLYSADVVVARPGHNVTYEALAGSAEVILIPGISYMETQLVYVRYLKEKYGIHTAYVDDIDILSELIQSLLDHRKRRANRTLITPYQEQIAQAIINESDYLNSDNLLNRKYTNIPIFVVFGNVPEQHRQEIERVLTSYGGTFHLTTSSPSARYNIPDLDYILLNQSPDMSLYNYSVFLHASQPISLRQQYLVDNHVRAVLYTRHGDFGISAKEWCLANLPNSGIIGVELHHLYAPKGNLHRFSYRIQKMLKHTKTPLIYIDTSTLRNDSDIIESINELCRWIINSGFNLLTLEDMINISVNIQLISPFDIDI